MIRRLGRLGEWLPFVGLFLLYYFVFVEAILRGQAIPGGDTLLSQQLLYDILFSLREFRELPWWDPTMSNGYPIYFHFVGGEINVFSPHYLLFYCLFMLFGWLSSDLNQWIYFANFVFIPLINGALILLIGRQLTRHLTAAYFPVVVYYFSYIALFTQHDYSLVAALPEALFFLYALIRYFQDRTPAKLGVWILSTGIYCFSFCYASLASSAFWLVALVLSLMVMDTKVVGTTARNWLLLWKRGRLSTITLHLFLLISMATPLWVLHSNRDLIRYRGGVVELDSSGDVIKKEIPVEAEDPAAMILNWAPRPRDGMFLNSHAQNYYLGMAVLILAVLALLSSGRSLRLAWAFFLAYSVCNLFLIFAGRNLLYLSLLEHFSLLKSVRNMGSLLPRGGASLLLIFSATVGMDWILTHRRRAKSVRWVAGLFGALGVLALVSVAGAGVSLQGVLSPPSLFHAGIYLVLFSILIFLLVRFGARAPFVGTFFLFLVFDLIIAQSAYLKKLTGTDLSSGVSRWVRLPNLEGLTPKPSPRLERSQSIPDQYRNDVIPFGGTPEWLVLQSYPQTRGLLAATRSPDFLFCTGAARVPMASIREAQVLFQAVSLAPVIVHEDFPPVSQQGIRCEPMRPTISEFTFSRVVAGFRIPEEGVILYRNNFNPGWTLNIDGNRQRLYRANFAYSAFPISSGVHEVSLGFFPASIPVVFIFNYLLLVLSMVQLLPLAKPARTFRIAEWVGR